MRECHDGAQSGHRVGVLREQHDYPSNERAPIRVWIQSEDAELRSRLLQELAEHAGIEAHVGSILDRSRLSAGRDEEPRHVILLHDRAFAAMARDSREAVRALAANHAVLLLLDTVNGDIVHEILRNRFRGYLLTACAGDSVAKAVRAVGNGDYWLPRSILAEVLQQWIAASASSKDSAVPVGVAMESFTSREQEVLALVKQGLSNKQIANELGVVEDTVKKHLQHIYDKLGIRRRTLILANGVSV